MRIDFEKLKNEVIFNLENNRTWVLSTASDGNVSSRSMSIINKGLNIYFQTNKCYIKHNQINKNNNVALCFNNISIEGVAEEIGDWKDEKNKELMELYKSVHLSSFNAYGLLDGQVVYKVTPKKIKIWKYINGNPIRQNLYVNEEIAEELDFM
ncbi:pyridoxamine 5'-phosphate oxidase family protein [Clostridium sartagoforme]|uniref:Pyridoxamine 5'-phosphate oxidase family protein n=1 Tax=Clostridium sartagoforme TaxID=84031 RepID=A0A4S2DHP1_9CLOT|nr:pyridoxamine 5'-phosphate oxidase family protein [Clostridium sartagoforme]TGY40471.1 pyridoxamine 5'-phosphate oxidase family protein [Clostridium sartagoforme]